MAQNDLTEQETDENAFAALFEEKSEQETESEQEAEQAEPEAVDEPEGEKPASDDDAQPQTHPEPETAEHSEPQGEKPDRPPETGAKDEPDWFQGLPSDVQQKLTEQTNYANHLHQSYSALLGRVPGLQRENADLKKQVESLQKQLGELSQAPTPTLDDLEKSDAFKDYAQDFPEEAQELKKQFTSQARAVEQAKREAQQAQQAIQEQRRQLVSREQKRLSDKHPDWMQVSNSPMFQQWKQAVLSNPHQFPEMANKLSSMWAEDNIDVLNQFKRDLAEVQGQQAQGHKQSERPQTTHRPKPPAPSPAPQGSGLSGNRRNQVPLSEEDEFDRLVRQGR